MKKLFSIAIVLVASIFATAAINASEVSDKFDALFPNFGVEDLQKRANAQEEWQAFCLKISNDHAKRAEAVKLMKENLLRGENAETVLAFLPVLGLIGEPADISTIHNFLNRDATFVDSVLAKEGRVLIEDEAVRALARIPGRNSIRALSSSNSIYARSGLIAHAKWKKVKVGVESQMPMAIPYASQR
ncbi:MAG: hypothetical protein LBK06_09560, partial [Planctomycetaceae bacterium]|nr:hypothetical protein [Planctomycetaceae bacterium]